MTMNPPAIVEQSETDKPDLLAQIIADAQTHAERTPKAQAFTVPPKSKDSKMQNVARALMVALGAGLDIHSTNKAVNTPGLEEQNSYLYGKKPSLGRLIGTKAAINLPLLYLAHKVAQKSPSGGMFVAGATAAPQAIAGISNYGLINEVKKK